MKVLVKILAVVAVGAASLVLSPAPPADSATCPRYWVIGVRGSGEGLVGPFGMGNTVGTYVQSASAGLPAAQTEYLSHPYPAAPVGPGYFDSVNTGWTTLRAVIRARIAVCPSIRIGLVGYSQGAHVVNETLRGLTVGELGYIRSVLQLADPRSDPAPSYHIETTIFGQPASRRTFGGILTEQALPAEVRSRATDYCFIGDPVCDAATEGFGLLAAAVTAPFHDGYRTCCNEINMVSVLGNAFANRMTAGWWRGWGSLGGITSASGAGAAARPSGELDIFVRGTDNAVWHKWWSPSSGWHAWESLGGGTLSEPAATARRTGELDVFVRGTDNVVYHRWWSASGGWRPWGSLGGTTLSAPAAAARRSGELDVVIRGTDNAVWHKWWSPSGGWRPWGSLGGTTLSAPAAAGRAGGELDILVRGTDNAVWHKWWSPSGGWRPWGSLGGTTLSAPAAAARPSGELDVVVRGTDNAVWHKWWSASGGWRPWGSLGGAATSAPGAAARVSGELDIFVRGTDNTIWHNWFG